MPVRKFRLYRAGSLTRVPEVKVFHVSSREFIGFIGLYVMGGLYQSATFAFVLNFEYGDAVPQFDAIPDQNRSQDPRFVHAVVQWVLSVPVIESSRLQKMGNEAHHEKAVQESAAVWAVFCRPFRVVVSLVVPAGNLAKDIHLHLINEYPVGDGDLLADVFVDGLQ